MRSQFVTQGELAFRVGVKENTVHIWITGRNCCLPEMLVAVCRELNIPANIGLAAWLEFQMRRTEFHAVALRQWEELVEAQVIPANVLELAAKPSFWRKGKREDEEGNE